MASVSDQPYLQPDPTRDCGFYATAYIARRLGFPAVTAQDVMAWREIHNKSEDWYLDAALGLERVKWPYDDGAERRVWWMGPGTREWVEGWLNAGWVGKAAIHRVQHMAHAVAVIGHEPAGVRLMDPVLGFVTEPWDWFLGIGPGTHGCHRIDSWYRAR